MRKLPINLPELEMALENTSWEQIYAFDLETGRVLFATTEDTGEVEEIYEEIGGAEGDESAAFEAALGRRDLPDWRRESLREAAQIVAELGTRYRRIDQADAHRDYQDMELFIDTVEDEDLRRQLERAISGRGAFRHFRDMLSGYPAVRERWYEFKNASTRERALEWLREEGIEPGDT